MLCLNGPRACAESRGSQGMARGRSLAEFQKAFADEASCATFLFKCRWPHGFVCPACGRRRANALKTRPRLVRMSGLRTPDLAHCRHRDAPLETASDDVVSGRAFDDDALQLACRHCNWRPSS